MRKQLLAVSGMLASSLAQSMISSKVPMGAYLLAVLASHVDFLKALSLVASVFAPVYNFLSGTIGLNIFGIAILL